MAMEHETATDGHNYVFQKRNVNVILEQPYILNKKG